jgi:hypothetical protein
MLNARRASVKRATLRSGPSLHDLIKLPPDVTLVQAPLFILEVHAPLACGLALSEKDG